jgi:hypothetical protein
MTKSTILAPKPVIKVYRTKLERQTQEERWQRCFIHFVALRLDHCDHRARQDATVVRAYLDHYLVQVGCGEEKDG